MVQVWEEGMVEGSEAREHKGSEVNHSGSKGPCREMTDKGTKWEEYSELN